MKMQMVCGSEKKGKSTGEEGGANNLFDIFHPTETAAAQRTSNQPAGQWRGRRGGASRPVSAAALLFAPPTTFFSLTDLLIFWP
jgi:hypothetical protein